MSASHDCTHALRHGNCMCSAFVMPAFVYERARDRKRRGAVTLQTNEVRCESGNSGCTLTPARLSGELRNERALRGNINVVGKVLWSIANMGGLTTEVFTASSQLLAQELPGAIRYVKSDEVGPQVRQEALESSNRVLQQVAVAWLTLQVQGDAAAVVRPRHTSLAASAAPVSERQLGLCGSRNQYVHYIAYLPTKVWHLTPCRHCMLWLHRPRADGLPLTLQDVSSQPQLAELIDAALEQQRSAARKSAAGGADGSTLYAGVSQTLAALHVSHRQKVLLDNGLFCVHVLLDSQPGASAASLRTLFFDDSLLPATHSSFLKLRDICIRKTRRAHVCARCVQVCPSRRPVAC